jgi:hypothetical protein
VTAEHNPGLGAKLGPRITMLVVQGIIYAAERLHALKHRLAMAVFSSISDVISDEVDVTLGPMLARMHDMIGEDHPAYPYVHFLYTTSGQLKALAGTGAQISGILGSVSTIMNNELADVVYAYVRTNPHLLPDVSTLLQMQASGLIAQSEATDAIASQGINSGWSANMMLLAPSWPAIADGLELVRRGTATRDQFSAWARLNGVADYVVAMYLSLVDGPVSVADAALAVLRGGISQAEGESIAAQNGFDAASFQILINNTGEPPGLMQLLEGYRRGFIDKATLDKGILQSRYRDEWIPLLEQLRYEPMSVADAVNATNQNQLDATIARKYADENGLQPGDFDVLLATAGEPLSRTEMEDLYNRGLVTEDQVIQALRESRLKNKYNTLAFDLHRRVIPTESLQRILRYNGISTADAIKVAMESGYSQEDATTLVSSGAMERLRVFKDKVVASAVTLVEGNLMADSDAETLITGLGYTAEDAKFILQASDFRRSAKIKEQVVSSIRGKYVAHHIAKNDASGFLDALGVDAAQRDALLTSWIVESEAFTRTLTEAQVVKAVKLQLITTDEGCGRLTAMGYSATDAGLLIGGA